MGHSEAVKANTLAVLAANNGSQRQTARDLNLPLATVNKWALGKHINNDVSSKVDSKIEELGDLYEIVARRFVKSLADENDDAIKEMSPRDRIVTSATALDKMRLCREQPSPDAKLLAASSPDEIDAIIKAAIQRLIAKNLAAQAQPLQMETDTQTERD